MRKKKRVVDGPDKGCYRPTTLKLASKHCPRAMNFYHDGAPTDRRIFGVGIAVHALIQAAIEATNQLGQPLDEAEFDAITLTSCKTMIGKGREFEGVPEPPLPADDVWEGRELARAYFLRDPIEPATLAEVGMAVDHEWKPTTYSAKARLRLIADYLTVTVEEDEETSARVLVVRDYKSAWPTDETELDTVQLRAQAVLAFLFHGEGVDCVRQEVTNLRTGATYSRELWMLDGGAETLERWQEEIDATMQALDDSRDADGLYPASPGGGCEGCPYLAQCEDGLAWSEAAHEHSTTLERARAWATLSARVKELGKVLRAETAEAPVSIGDGHVVGRVGKDRRQPRADAWRMLRDEWEARGGDDGGLVLALDIGVGQIDKVGKKLYPERADVPDRKAWIASLVETVVVEEFGVHRDDVDLMAALRASLASSEGGEQ